MAEPGGIGGESHVSQTSCTVCELCGAFENLKLCANCKGTWYCSREHQKAHWKEHKWACRGIQNPAGTVCKQTQDSGQLSGQTDNPQFVTIDSADARMFSTLQTQPEETTTVSRDNNATNNGSSHQYDVPAPGARPKNRRRGRGKPQASTPQEPTEPPPPEETKLADYVVKCLNGYGICVVDNFMGIDKCEMVLNEVKALEDKGYLHDGQTLSTLNPTEKVREDKITWVEKGDTGCDYISRVLNRLDALMMVCRKRFGQYTIQGRTKTMVACYPGSGTGYRKHVDNPNNDGRCITCIYYLNKNWDVKKDGGLLRIYPVQFNQVADIEPKFDRLLFFWSDRRNPHEVQPSYRTRYAMTVWFLDADERTRARLKHTIKEVQQLQSGGNENRPPEDSFWQ